MADDIKKRFGKQLRRARDAKKLSRAALALRLGISPKTVQSWEMGRTFIENLSLIPAIETELDIAVWDLIARATHPGRGAIAAESPTAYGRRSALPKAGPIPPHFNLYAVKSRSLPTAEKIANGYVAVPLLRPQAVTKAVSELVERDISAYTIIPGDWVPRGGVVVAYRMADSGMVPMIPLGATVIVDRRPLDARKALNKVVALNLQGKGLRVRRLIEDPVARKLVGMTAVEGQRGKTPFRPDLGDTILGRVVGIQAQPA